MTMEVPLRPKIEPHVEEVSASLADGSREHLDRPEDQGDCRNLVEHRRREHSTLSPQAWEIHGETLV